MTDQILQVLRQEQQADADPAAFLAKLGDRVREIRARRGMSRKVLARDSGVSERYLAQLETGQGNISILLLRQLAHAVDTPLSVLVREGAEPPVEVTRAIELLRRLTPEELRNAHRMLLDQFGGAAPSVRRGRIALVGLRGAGKSTLGKMLAERLACPFIELDREVEAEAGASLATIFDLYGQPAFRRLERRCLERVTEQPRVVMATGGGIVSDPATFERLLASYYTIWLKASPQEHMERVISQGDTRPMAHNREAMADLRRILKTREPLYGQADLQVDTTGLSAEASLQKLLGAIQAGAEAD